MQSGECVLLEQPVEDVAVSNVLVVAEPDGIQGELCDVEETSICEIPVEQRIVICCRLQCISVFRERQRQHLELDISSGEMDDFAFFQNRPVKWMIFAEWVSDIDVRLGKSEVMLRSFDGIHECVCSAYMSDTFFSANWQEHVSFLQDSGAYIEHVSSYGGWRGS